MPECDSVSCAYTLDSIEPASVPGTRIAHLLCTFCDARLARLTQRSDAEIQAELDAMDGS